MNEDIRMFLEFYRENYAPMRAINMPQDYKTEKIIKKQRAIKDALDKKIQTDRNAICSKRKILEDLEMQRSILSREVAIKRQQIKMLKIPKN